MISPDSNREPRRLVLVVEDEMLVRFLITDTLVEMGMQVVEAANGDEALRFLRMVGSVDLVFTDVHMPGQTDGLELARVMQRDFPEVPVVVTSGLLRQDDVPVHVSFVPKPYDVQTMAQQIFAILDAK